MKRSKINRLTAPVPTAYPRLLHDEENVENDEYSDEIPNFRMLENLKMALFFSRMQSQMNKEMQQEQ